MLLLLPLMLLMRWPLCCDCCAPGPVSAPSARSNAKYTAITRSEAPPEGPDSLRALLDAFVPDLEFWNETMGNSTEQEHWTTGTIQLITTSSPSSSESIATIRHSSNDPKASKPYRLTAPVADSAFALPSDRHKWKSFISMFPDLSTFSMPNLFKRNPLKWTSGEKYAKILTRTKSKASLVLTLTPPVSWTFCEPNCGVGDQAVDAESAIENAQEDIRDIMINAFKREGVTIADEEEITVVYNTTSTLLDDFGEFYDRSDTRYHADNGVVVSSRHATRPGHLQPYFVTVKVMVSSDLPIGRSVWRLVANDVLINLSTQKHARFKDTVNVIL